MLIEGKNKDLPVVITLHGGPGTPIPFSVGCRVIPNTGHLPGVEMMETLLAVLSELAY